VPQPALVEPLRRWDPEQVGGFVLVGRLGAGAMGRVYLGRSAAGRLVAVKTIKAELAEELDFRTRFAQEVAAARRVSGAFTAAVVAADPEADVPWLATAYVPAPSLSQLVRICGPLPVPAVRWLAAGCAEALESIHGAGLVHRDLKPSNVLVSLDGPRVIDFGVARAAERIQLTVTRGAVGTPAYMAPEQARDTRQATMASDVFALGGTMLFAATGHAPYQGETVMDVLVRLATEEPDLSGLPGSLAEIVIACLQRDPRRRPTSASVVAWLAPFISAEAGGSDAGATFLPGAAQALIAEYRRDPRPSAEATARAGPESGQDATFGSQPGLREAPAGPRPGGAAEAGLAAADCRPRRGRGGGGRGDGIGRGHRRRHHRG
jgi:serine/threonine protein kinase